MKNEIKTGHTKGPWTYQGTMNGRDILIAPSSAATWEYQGKTLPASIQSGQALAVVKMKDSVESAGAVDGEAEANARLIAAAPMLLSALEEIKRWADMAKPGTFSQEWMAQARAAISAAKGETR